MKVAVLHDLLTGDIKYKAINSEGRYVAGESHLYHLGYTELPTIQLFLKPIKKVVVTKEVDLDKLRYSSGKNNNEFEVKFDVPKDSFNIRLSYDVNE